MMVASQYPLWVSTLSVCLLTERLTHRPIVHLSFNIKHHPKQYYITIEYKHNTGEDAVIFNRLYESLNIDYSEALEIKISLNSNYNVSNNQ